jgi:hypothetical protein
MPDSSDLCLDELLERLRLAALQLLAAAAVEAEARQQVVDLVGVGLVDPLEAGLAGEALEGGLAALDLGARFLGPGVEDVRDDLALLGRRGRSPVLLQDRLLDLTPRLALVAQVGLEAPDLGRRLGAEQRVDVRAQRLEHRLGDRDRLAQGRRHGTLFGVIPSPGFLQVADFLLGRGELLLQRLAGRAARLQLARAHAAQVAQLDREQFGAAFAVHRGHRLVLDAGLVLQFALASGHAAIGLGVDLVLADGPALALGLANLALLVLQRLERLHEGVAAVESEHLGHVVRVHAVLAGDARWQVLHELRAVDALQVVGAEADPLLAAVGHLAGAQQPQGLHVGLRVDLLRDLVGDARPFLAVLGAALAAHARHHLVEQRRLGLRVGLVDGAQVGAPLGLRHAGLGAVLEVGLQADALAGLGDLGVGGEQPVEDAADVVVDRRVEPRDGLVDLRQPLLEAREDAGQRRRRGLALHHVRLGGARELLVLPGREFAGLVAQPGLHRGEVVLELARRVRAVGVGGQLLQPGVAGLVDQRAAVGALEQADDRAPVAERDAAALALVEGRLARRGRLQRGPHVLQPLLQGLAGRLGVLHAGAAQLAHAVEHGRLVLGVQQIARFLHAAGQCCHVAPPCEMSGTTRAARSIRSSSSLRRRRTREGLPGPSTCRLALAVAPVTVAPAVMEPAAETMMAATPVCVDVADDDASAEAVAAPVATAVAVAAIEPAADTTVPCAGTPTTVATTALLNAPESVDAPTPATVAAAVMEPAADATDAPAPVTVAAPAALNGSDALEAPAPVTVAVAVLLKLAAVADAGSWIARASVMWLCPPSVAFCAVNVPAAFAETDFDSSRQPPTLEDGFESREVKPVPATGTVPAPPAAVSDEKASSVALALTVTLPEVMASVPVPGVLGLSWALPLTVMPPEVGPVHSVSEPSHVSPELNVMTAAWLPLFALCRVNHCSQQKLVASVCADPWAV